MSNRAQRRKYAKTINTPKKFEQSMNYALSVERENMRRQIKQNKEDVIEIVLTMTAYTIQYKLGFGKKRLNWIMDKILNNIESFYTGHLTPDDYREIRETLYKKYEMKF